MTLKELRKRKQLSQLKASEICGVPLRSYKRLENEQSYENSIKYKDAFSKLESFSNAGNTSVSGKKILVIGAGYVGLSISVLLSLSNEVSVVDLNKDKVDKINNRIPVFKDNDIAAYFKNKKLNLKSYSPDDVLYRDKDYIIISIPTDLDPDKKVLKCEEISNLVKNIRLVNKKALIVIKSTCNIEFTDSLGDRNVIYSPEFLREGNALHDNLYPSRIIIGGDKNNKKVREFAGILQELSLNRAKIMYVSPSEAESIKLFSNAYLAMRVAFFNELDSFALSKSLNSKNIVDGVSLDPRIGDFYNNPSFGYGGYCLPKDTLSLVSLTSEIDNNELISSISKSNDSRKESIVLDIINKLKERNGHIVGIYSIESKKDSDNKRHAAILDIIKGLEARRIEIMYFDSIKDIDEFKKKSDLILMNRYLPIFDDVKDKIYTRDIYRRD